MDDSEVDEGDCAGESRGDAAAVDGDDSAVSAVIVLRKAARLGTAVEAIVGRYRGLED